VLPGAEARWDVDYGDLVSGPTDAPAGSLTPDEQKHQQIFTGFTACRISLLYEAIAHNLSLQNIRTADWSTAVAPFGMW